MSATKPRILCVHNHYMGRGGESEAFDNEVRGLREHGHEVVLFTRSNEEIGRLPPSGKAAAVAASVFSLTTRSAIERLVRAERPAVAIVQNVFPLISPSAYHALHAAGVPIIQAVYNYRFICPAGELYSLGEICERCVGGNHLPAVTRGCYRDSRAASAWYASLVGVHRAMGTFAEKIDAFMVPDAFMARKLVEGGLPESKMWTNPNPFFLPERVAEASDGGYVLYVGRLVRQKGVLTAIEAMRHATTRTRLVVVGSGELEREITQAIAHSDLAARVSFVGSKWGDDLAALMAGARALVIPSEWYDNLPLVLCQANGMGKPVLASRINGIPEYVEEGVNGHLFTPGDRFALAALIDRVTTLPTADYVSLCRASRRYAEEHFDYSIHYERLSALMAMVTAAKPHGRGG